MTDHVHLAGLRIRAGSQLLVDRVELRLEAGRVTALVGASGSGKTLTARALLGLVDLEPGVVRAELRIAVDGRLLTPYAGRPGTQRARDRAFAGVRGRVMSYLPQDPRAALDPLQRVGPQVATAARVGGASPDPGPWLARAGIPDPDRVAALHPHELSGGMAQRVAIAQALATGARFLLADEPTTALDPTVASAVVAELARLRSEGIGILFITHDLRILPGFADTICVMHGGRLVEEARPDALREELLTTEAARRLVAATRKVAAGRLG